MKQNRDCKIVQDLLPTYIESLTNEVTNEFIEEHIARCPECAQVLKDMNGDLQLEKINQDYEINYLKKLKMRWVNSIWIIGVIIAVIAFGVVMYINKKSQMQINNYTFLRAETRLPDSACKDGYEDIILVAVIDENGKCKSARVAYKGYTEEGLKEQYENYMLLEADEITNLQIVGNEIHRNINIWNGSMKDDVKQDWIDSYKIQEIEEI